MAEKDNIIQRKSFEFAVAAVRLSRELRRSGDFIISAQLLKSATSVGANVEEALAGQSRKDFVSKLSIASKEARETRYWLRLLQATREGQKDYSAHLADIDEIIRILTAIVKTIRAEKPVVAPSI
jgi:four helix bundle protein